MKGNVFKERRRMTQGVNVASTGCMTNFVVTLLYSGD